MAALAVAGQHLRRLGHAQVELDPSLAEGRLQRLRDLAVGRGRHRIDRDREAPAQPRLGKKRLGLGHVEFVGLLGQRAGHTLRHRRLVDLVLAAKQLVSNAFVVDQPTHRLPHLGPGEIRIGLVERQVEHGAARHLHHLQIGLRCDGLHLVGVQVGGHVDVALFQQQALRRRLRHVPHDHALDARRRAARITGEGLDHHRVLGFPFDQPVGAGARRTGAQPCVAQVAVLRVDHHQLAVDHRGDGGAERAEHQIDGIGLVERNDQLVALRAHLLLDVVLGPAELAQDDRRRLAQQHAAAQRERSVLGGERVARLELQPLPHLEHHLPPVSRSLPALGRARNDLLEIARVVLHQPQIEVIERVA
ncbi:hypothetical protein D9M72_430160 [compost metagenome]